MPEVDHVNDRAADVSVRFWGVRGSLACPGPDTVIYGGNTSCVEVRCGEHRLVFDAGTGIRPLGQSLIGSGAVNLDLFLSHTHLDHVVGLPFFPPLFDPDSDIRLWAGHLRPEHGLVDVLGSLMTAPLFPVPIERFGCDPSYNDFVCGKSLNPKPGVNIHTARLNHPGRASGYRVEYGGRTICYVTDTEHTPGTLDERIRELIQGADLVIYDSTYTDEEYALHEGWGHSTWQEGIRLCDAAGAKTLAAFHHDPAHDDRVLEAIGKQAEAERPGTIVAREDLVIQL